MWKPYLAATAPLILVYAMRAPSAVVEEEPADEKFYSPSDVVAMAAADCAKLPAGVRPLVRYLDLANLVDRKERDLGWAVLSFHCNSLSNEPEIAKPVFTDGRKVLLRINLSDYGWKKETWEKLLEDEPYFHAKVQEVKKVKKTKVINHPGGDYRYPDGRVVRNVKAGEYEIEVEETQGSRGVAVALAPWVSEGPAGKENLTALVTMTSSQVPIVRGDWFFSRTAIQRDKGAGYYDFLNLGKKVEDFDELVGFSEALAKKFKDERFGVVVRSAVALNNRRLIRMGKIGGAKWFTLDAKDNTDKRNFVRVLNGDAEHDATEQIATLPNGLHAYFLANAAGARQNTAPDFIASDSTAPGTDRRVHAGLSCVRCHGAVAGIQPVADYVRQLVRMPLELQSPDYETAKRLRQLYLSDLGKLIKRDQDDYAEAVKATNGLAPAANAKAYGDWWNRYVEEPVRIEQFARDLGTTPARLKLAMLLQVKATGSLDSVLAGLLQNPEIPMRREQAEEVVPIAQQYLSQVRP